MPKKASKETMALTVVDPQPEPEVVKPPPVYPEIKNNDMLLLKRAGHENAPVSDKPFYLTAGDGLYLNKPTVLGQGWVKLTHYPKWFPELGGEKFTFLIDRMIPTEICAQVHGFFKRIYDKYQTEAEVIFLMNYETKEWEVYIPWQKVSGAHVTSAVVPTEIPLTHQVVGSAHSHASMTAFHSGTDMGDASDMDGAHFTLGRFDEEQQEIVAMIMVNGKDFTYKAEDLGDWSTTAEPPEEWDDRVYPASRMSEMSEELKEIFVKFGKERAEPKKAKPNTYQSSYKPVEHKPYTYAYNLSDNWDEYGYGAWQRNWQENRRKSDWEKNTGTENVKPDLTDRAKLDAPHWEDFIADETIDMILDASIFNETDWDTALESKDSTDIKWWHTLFLRKLSENINILNKLGIVVDYKAYPKDHETESMIAKRLRKIREAQARAESDDLLPVDGEFVEVSGTGELSDSALARKLIEEGFHLLKVEKDEDGKERVHIDVGKFQLTDD